MFYVRGEVPALILHLLPDSVARKTRRHTCFISDARPAVTLRKALWCQKHTEALEDDGIRDMVKAWKCALQMMGGWERKKEMKNPEKKRGRKLNDFLVLLPPLRQMWWLQQMWESLHGPKSSFTPAFLPALTWFMKHPVKKRNRFFHQVQGLSEFWFQHTRNHKTMNMWRTKSNDSKMKREVRQWESNPGGPVWVVDGFYNSVKLSHRQSFCLL